MKLEWSLMALADREAIFDLIEARNPKAAIAVDERIEAAAHRLMDFPESGRPGRVAATRELVVTGTPYILPYRVIGQTIRILRVLHGARLWPDNFSSEA